MISSKWSLLYTRLIYSNGPIPYIATLPEPNKDLLVFESIPPYIPVPGVRSVEGIPRDNTTPVKIAEFANVFATFVVTIPPNATIASVFADI